MEMVVGTHTWNVRKSDSWTIEQYKVLAQKYADLNIKMPMKNSERKNVIVDRVEFLRTWEDFGYLNFSFQLYGHEESWRGRQPLL